VNRTMTDSGHDCRSDLVARARRGRLSPAENLALQAHLAGCATCRLSRRVLSDFVEMKAVDHHDGARVERLSAAARRWTQGRVLPRRRRGATRRIRFLAFAAGLALLAGTASAAIWLRHRPAPPEASSESSLRTLPPAARVPARRSVSAIEAAGSVTPAPVAPDPTVAVLEPPTPAFEPTRRRAATETARPTPALLLRRAGDAQRSGQSETALALYRQLRRDHPSTPEAMLATVPLGRLLLERSPRAALAEFDSYLRSSPAGALVPEALYGRARALGALGDAARERQTWEQLLGRFPDSAYVPVGRRRLAELR
jgi:Putative zinc-finger/Tetratricopeptide repeat